jgi:hypothetical protein
LAVCAADEDDPAPSWASTSAAESAIAMVVGGFGQSVSVELCGAGADPPLALSFLGLAIVLARGLPVWRWPTRTESWAYRVPRCRRRLEKGNREFYHPISGQWGVGQNAGT